MDLYIKGKIEGLKEVKDKAGNVVGYQLQFIRKEGETLSLFQAKCDAEICKDVEVGKEITASVSVSTFNNNIYYKIVKVINLK